MKELLNAQIIGCGPAGLSLVVSADAHSDLDQFLSLGTAFIDGNTSFGAGYLNGVKSPSNSQAIEFLNAVGTQGIFQNALQERSTREVATFGEHTLPLPFVASFLETIGKAATHEVEDHPDSQFLAHTRVEAIHVAYDGESNVFTSLDHYGGEVARSRQIVLAPGAQERAYDFGSEERNRKRFVSHEVLSDQYHDEIEGRLHANGGRMIIVGGSHSALATAALSLEQYDIPFGPQSITIFHRSPVRIFYESEAEALMDGYHYRQEDICSISGRVGRFSGVRGEAKTLSQKVASKEEERVVFVRSQENFYDLPELDSTAIIVQALGFEARSIPIIDSYGRVVGPLKVNGRVEVDRLARILDNNGKVIEGAYAMGLGHGYKPNAEIGGEPSAVNHPVDAFNFYAGPVGKIVYHQLLAGRG